MVCFYRPIHLILTNTKNGTELKLNDPENYRKYVELNVKYVEKPIRGETTDQVKSSTMCSTKWAKLNRAE